MNIGKLSPPYAPLTIADAILFNLYFEGEAGKAFHGVHSVAFAALVLLSQPSRVWAGVGA
jgi:hypothetical protein